MGYFPIFNCPQGRAMLFSKWYGQELTSGNLPLIQSKLITLQLDLSSSWKHAGRWIWWLLSRHLTFLGSSDKCWMGTRGYVSRWGCPFNPAFSKGLCIPSCISTINCLIFLALVYTLLVIWSFYFSVGIKSCASLNCVAYT